MRQVYHFFDIHGLLKKTDGTYTVNPQALDFLFANGLTEIDLFGDFDLKFQNGCQPLFQEGLDLLASHGLHIRSVASYLDGAFLATSPKLSNGPSSLGCHYETSVIPLELLLRDLRKEFLKPDGSLDTELLQRCDEILKYRKRYYLLLLLLNGRTKTVDGRPLTKESTLADGLSYLIQDEGERFKYDLHRLYNVKDYSHGIDEPDLELWMDMRSSLQEIQEDWLKKNNKHPMNNGKITRKKLAAEIDHHANEFTLGDIATWMNDVVNENDKKIRRDLTDSQYDILMTYHRHWVCYRNMRFCSLYDFVEAEIKDTHRLYQFMVTHHQLQANDLIILIHDAAFATKGLKQYHNQQQYKHYLLTVPAPIEPTAALSLDLFREQVAFAVLISLNVTVGIAPLSRVWSVEDLSKEVQRFHLHCLKQSNLEPLQRLAWLQLAMLYSSLSQPNLKLEQQLALAYYHQAIRLDLPSAAVNWLNELVETPHFEVQLKIAKLHALLFKESSSHAYRVKQVGFWRASSHTISTALGVSSSKADSHLDRVDDFYYQCGHYFLKALYFARNSETVSTSLAKSPILQTLKQEIDRLINSQHLSASQQNHFSQLEQMEFGDSLNNDFVTDHLEIETATPSMI